MKKQVITRRIGSKKQYESRFRIEVSTLIKDGERLQPDPVTHPHPFEMMAQYEKWALAILRGYGFDIPDNADYMSLEYDNRRKTEKYKLTKADKDELLERGMPENEIPDYGETVPPEKVGLFTHIAQTVNKPEFELMEEGLACKILQEVIICKHHYQAEDMDSLFRSTCKLMEYVHQIDYCAEELNMIVGKNRREQVKDFSNKHNEDQKRDLEHANWKKEADKIRQNFPHLKYKTDIAKKVKKKLNLSEQIDTITKRI